MIDTNIPDIFSTIFYSGPSTTRLVAELSFGFGWAGLELL